jgi:hypothetical protein
MLAATPIDGGHYFVDMIAGLAIAALAIAAARQLSQAITRIPGPRTQHRRRRRCRDAPLTASHTRS